VILVTQEAEIRRKAVGSQPRQIVRETLSRKKPTPTHTHTQKKKKEKRKKKKEKEKRKEKHTSFSLLNWQKSSISKINVSC
jgi:hypothetical protein